jgi:hypothetical protein
VTNLLSVAVAVAGRLILILQLLPTLGLGGVAGSCLVIVTSGCLVSVLNQSFSGVRFSSEVQSISPLSSCSTYSTVAPVLIDAQGNQTNRSPLSLFFLPTYRMVAPVDAQGNQTEDILKDRSPGHPSHPPQSTSADPLTTSFNTNRFCFTAPNHGSYPIPLHRD